MKVYKSLWKFTKVPIFHVIFWVKIIHFCSLLFIFDVLCWLLFLLLAISKYDHRLSVLLRQFKILNFHTWLSWKLKNSISHVLMKWLRAEFTVLKYLVWQFRVTKQGLYTKRVRVTIRSSLLLTIIYKCTKIFNYLLGHSQKMQTYANTFTNTSVIKNEKPIDA